MKTATAAITKWSKMGFSAGIVFQYPRGHWGCCTIDSPTGRSIAKNGTDTVGTQIANWRYISHRGAIVQ